MEFCKKKSRFARQKKNILTLVLSEKKILNETKNHNPPFKLNGRSLTLVTIVLICTNDARFCGFMVQLHVIRYVFYGNGTTVYIKVQL